MVDKLSSTEMKTIHQSQDTIKKSEMASFRLKEDNCKWYKSTRDLQRFLGKKTATHKKDEKGQETFQRMYQQ